MRVLAIKLVIVHTAAPESARKNPPVMLEKSLGPTVMKENFRGSRFSLRTERMRLARVLSAVAFELHPFPLVV